MTKTVLHKADSRGVSSNGWIYAKHTFCFADYYNTERIHFGALRVINDLTIAPGKGLDFHSNSDIEIILLTIKGDVIHRDDLGNEVELQEGSVQVLTTGSGYSHEEINKNKDQSVKLLQIWIFPFQKNLQPAYSWKQFEIEEGRNQLQLLVSPDKEDNVTLIQQNTRLYITNLDRRKSLTYELNDKNNGVYVLVTKGKVEVEGYILEDEDGLGVWETGAVSIKAKSASQVIVIEVPMDAYK
ncbi:pirin family protein [Paludibacter sp. 221]|uniref:pirin family protein n=1 Tax=Paludibacter sp. 221 TaxID=2302939 RepID=UPI0013D44DA7|nr:pirin family protein [Paludibacter sp. 221]NDV46353.1 pirin family protein [Paludibacter sp. 221]